MKEFLQRKNVMFSFKKYGTDSLSYMALGLFSTLIIGLILSQIGDLTNIEFLTELGDTASSLAGAGIGISVAYSLQAPPLVLFSNLIVGDIGYTYGGPMGALLASIIATEIGKIVSKETKVDIIVTPFVTIIVGGVFAYYLGFPISAVMAWISAFIETTTKLLPLLMGVLTGISMGMILTLPISSAGIGISLGLTGLSAGAACAGCSAQMVGFAVSSYRENKLNGLISQGIGTSMLQISNIVKNPRIWIPPTIASGICGGLSTTLFKLENTPYGSGMGTSGLVGQLGAAEAMGYSNELLIKVVILNFILPAIISLVVCEYMRKRNYIKFGDMTI